MNFLELVQEEYKEISDLVIKPIKGIHLIYLETLADQDKINDYILKAVASKRIITDIKKVLPSPNVKDIKNYKELKLYLETGFTIVLTDNEAIAIETKANITRSIDTPSTEPTIFGPKDSLTENYQINLGLIKRRIKSNHLKNEVTYIGRFTKTLISTLYIDNVAEKELVDQVREKMQNIVIDGINDIGELKQFLVKETKNVFPAFKMTERPDIIAKSLLEGK